MNFFARSSTKSKAKSKPRGKATPPAPLLNSDQFIDLIGLVLIAVAVITLLSALSPGGQGNITGVWVGGLKLIFGWGMLIAPVLLLAFGGFLVAQRFGDRFPRPSPGRIFGIFLAYLAALGLFHVFNGVSTDRGLNIQPQFGMGGGTIGFSIFSALSPLGDVGASVLLLGGLLMSLTLISGLTLAQLGLALEQFAGKLRIRFFGHNAQSTRERPIVPRYDPSFRQPKPTNGIDDSENIDSIRINGLRPRGAEPKPGKKSARNFVVEPVDQRDRSNEQEEDVPAPIQSEKSKRIGPSPVAAKLGQAAIASDVIVNMPTRNSPPAEYAPSNARRVPPPHIIGGINSAASAAASSAIQMASEPSRTWTLPDTSDVLEVGKDVTKSASDLRERAKAIEETLISFGVPAKVTEVNPGPTITQFCVEPGFTQRGQSSDRFVQRVKDKLIASIISETSESEEGLSKKEATDRFAEYFDITEIPSNDGDLVTIKSRRHNVDLITIARSAGGKVVEGVPGGRSVTAGLERQKVKVSRIAALADDLALSLAAPRIRIEAPVPGKSYVGIEVPNGETSLVSLRDVMESEEYEALARKTRLRLGLGSDVSGHPVVADLSAMPHLLIAGTTGSGKSVCVNSIITALLINNSPDDLRLLMVDPKRVELTGYNGIPHLIAPVVVDLEQVSGVLKWTTSEMDRRYRTFARYGSRNIVDFNEKVREKQQKNMAAADQGVSESSADSELKHLPYIVLIIDELADLMMLAPDETEKTICRLAQMARATGIHLILATQRPSVDVVTGLIKANFPARIAFTVASAIDSRVILDSVGAEKLLGRGDMLVLKPDLGSPQRAQGCFLSDKEIQKVVRHWRAQAAGGTVVPGPLTPVQMRLPISQKVMDGAGLPSASNLSVVRPGDTPTWTESPVFNPAAGVGETAPPSVGADTLFDEAVATVRLQGKASISLLQRRLRIGYTRSARMIEEMEEKGIVGPSLSGSQFREVLPAK